ncbi:MAG TPA: hypothetical protein VGI19_18650 [Candidatus Cybelea sp.]|jgi:hypothetical protein
MANRAEIEKQLDTLVTVVLASGPRLTGVLQRSAITTGLLEFEVLGADGIHQGFEWNDVQEILPVHPAEAAAEQQLCTCRRSDDPAADFESEHNCPIHQFDMSDASQYQAYEVWRAGVFAAIRDSVPAYSGAWTQVDADFKNVVFQISAAEKPEGDDGVVIVQIDLTRTAPPTPERRAFVDGNWRTDDELDVAKKALAAYAALLRSDGQ